MTQSCDESLIDHFKTVPRGLALRIAFLQGKGTSHVLRARSEYIEEKIKKLIGTDAGGDGEGDSEPGVGEEIQG